MATSTGLQRAVDSLTKVQRAKMAATAGTVPAEIIESLNRVHDDKMRAATAAPRQE